MAPTRDDNARDKRSVLRPNPATFLKDFALYMTLKYAIIRKRCLNYTACLTVIRLLCAFAHIRFQLKFRVHAGGLRLNKKIEIFIWSRISKFLRPAQRYDDFKLIRITCQAACHGKTEHGIFVKFKQSLNKRAKLLSSYLPGSPSRVLRAPGTSPYHLVPKHLRATWPRPEQSHLLPEACSPDGTDKRRQRQRQTERPPPEPSNILKRFCALYDVEIRYYKKKVSKLYCLFNRNPPIVRICAHSIPAKISSSRRRITVKQENRNFYMVPYLQIFAPGAAL